MTGIACPTYCDMDAPMNPEPKLPPKAGARAPSRLWKWAKRILWAGLGLVLVLVIFHRPLLRFALERVAPPLAKSAGLELSWEVDGTVVGGVNLTEIKVTGDASAPLQKLTARRVKADYSLWDFFKKGAGQFVHEVILDDVDLVLDTTKFPPPVENDEAPSAPPEVSLPVLRLHNVNARVILADGEVVLRGLNFTIEPGGSGVFEFTALKLPGTLPAMKSVKGTTLAEAAKLTLQSLQLMPDLKVEELSVDLNELEKSKLAFTAALTVPGGTMSDSLAAGGGNQRTSTGNGEVKLTGSLESFDKSPVLNATAMLTMLTPATLKPWVELPPDLNWSVPEITATVNGDVNSPRTLKAVLTAKAAGIAAANVRVDSVALDAALENGVFTLRKLDAAVKENHVTATATAQMPETWAEAGLMEVKALAEVNVKELADFFAPVGGGEVPLRGPLSGALTGRMNATLAKGALTLTQADLRGAKWLVQGVPVESVELTATSDGKSVNLARVRASLDAQNTVEASGTMSLEDAQAVEAQWSADIPNLERLAQFTGQKDTPGPDGGWLKGTGKLSGSLADWQRQDFSKTTAEARLDASNVAWKQGRMESLALDATVEGGRAMLRSFAAVVNGKNKLTASGSGALAAPFAFTAKVDGDLSQLTDLNGWMESLGAQKLLGGKAVITWQGGGTAENLALTGGGAVTVEGFRMEGMKEAASLNLKTAHNGQRADITQLEASLGDLRFSAPCVVTDKLLEIPAITVSAGKLPPVTGHVRVPLDFAQQGGMAGPVATNGNLDVSLNVKGWDLAEAARAAGQKPPVNGRLDADVKITGPIGNPAADIALNLQKVISPDMAKKLAPADGTVKITLKDRKLALNADVMQKPLQTLRAVANMPLDVEKLLKNPDSLQSTPLDVSVNLPDSDLNALKPFVDGIASMKGVLGLTAKISGTLTKPVITGDFHASAPAIVFKEADMPAARDVRLRVRFDGTRIYIEDAGAMLAGGTVGAKGSVDWADTSNPKLDATLTAREALLLRDDSISMRANADITCRGSLNQATVAGKVELVRGRVFQEIEFLPLSLPNSLPPAPPPVTVGNSGPPSLPPPLDKWIFDVSIVTRDDIRLLGNVLNGGVVSDLKFTGPGARPVLEGKVSLKDARVRLPFSRMAISRGDVIFKRDKPFEPVLDVQGDSFVNSYQVTLQAYGSAFDPKIRFTSSPPLPEGEIATLLATGSTSGDLKGSEGEAANRAAFLVISKMYRKLFRKGALAKEDDEPPRLSFSFSPLNNSSGSGRSFSAVYEINKNLQATGSMSQRGSFRGLLYYLIRFR